MPPRRDKRVATAERDGAVEKSIFDATERVLRNRSIREASVAELIAAAGVSRATFYFYFASKYEVVTELFQRLLGDVFELFQARWLDRTTNPDEDQQEVLFELHSGCYALFREHAPIMRAVADAYPHEDVVSAAFEAMIGRLIDGCALKIADDREGGLAREGRDARELAAALIWMNERMFYVDSTPGSADWASDEAMARTAAAVWAAAIYG
jgi:AcrR family transcriptional regulator